MVEIEKKCFVQKYFDINFVFFVIYNASISQIIWNNNNYYITLWRFENYNRFRGDYYKNWKNEDFYNKKRELYN